MLKSKIIDILSKVCDCEEIRTNQELEIYNLGILDSFGTVQFLIALEEELNIYIPITEVDRELWATPKKIIDFLEMKQKNEAT